jgi:5'-nucleotidase
LPEGTTLNVNFPNMEKHKIKGMKIARGVKGTWEEKFVSAESPHDKNVFWLTGTFINYEPDAKDTDEYLINNGYTSIVPVKFDFNDYNFIDELSKWNFDEDSLENIGNQ